MGVGTSNIPVFINNLQKVKQISAGRYFTVFLMSDNTIMVTGINDWGQLGIPEQVKVSTPVKVPNIVNVSHIYTFGYGMVILLNDGKVMACGANNSNQLITISDDQKITTLTYIPNLTNVIDISCGSSNIIFITRENKLYSTGNNSSGQLCIGNTDISKTINIINDVNILQLAKSYKQILILYYLNSITHNDFIYKKNDKIIMNDIESIKENATDSLSKITLMVNKEDNVKIKKLINIKE